jgi:F0F1-type ATP synthase membrane subunit b/b'
MSKASENRRNWLEQIKDEAEKQTRRRLEDADFDFHKEKEDAINAAEGVTEGTPVSEAEAKNPATPKTKK